MLNSTLFFLPGYNDDLNGISLPLFFQAVPKVPSLIFSTSLALSSNRPLKDLCLIIQTGSLVAVASRGADADGLNSGYREEALTDKVLIFKA